MGSAGTLTALLVVIMACLTCAFSAALGGHSGDFGSQQSPWSQHSQLTKRNAVQLCGSRLVEAVRGLCKGGLFTGYHRRSDPSLSGTGGFMSEDSQDLREPVSNSLDTGVDAMSVQYGTLDSYWDKDMDNSFSDLELLWPHNPKSLALKVLTEGKGHQRFRRNIIDECCKKSCSINDMAKYCGGNQRRITLY